MEQSRRKIVKIFLPFLFLNIGFSLFYIVCLWFIKQVLHIEVQNEEFLWFAKIPCALAAIPVLLWLRPGVKLLFWGTGFTGLARYCLNLGAALFFITGTSFQLQRYIANEEAKKTELKYISEINLKHESRYYSLKSHYIDTQHFIYTVVTKREIDDANNLSSTFYILFPLLDEEPKNQAPDEHNQPPDLIEDLRRNHDPTVIPKAWIEFYSPYYIPIKFNQEQRKMAVRDNIINSLLDYRGRYQTHFFYLENLGSSDLNRKEIYLSLIDSHHLSPAVRPIILSPVYEPFKSHANQDLSGLIFIFLIGTCIWFLLIKAPDMIQTQTKESQTRESPLTV